MRKDFFILSRDIFIIESNEELNKESRFIKILFSIAETFINSLDLRRLILFSKIIRYSGVI